MDFLDVRRGTLTPLHPLPSFSAARGVHPRSRSASVARDLGAAGAVVLASPWARAWLAKRAVDPERRRARTSDHAGPSSSALSAATEQQGAAGRGGGSVQAVGPGPSAHASLARPQGVQARRLRGQGERRAEARTRMPWGLHRRGLEKHPRPRPAPAAR